MLAILADSLIFSLNNLRYTRLASDYKRVSSATSSFLCQRRSLFMIALGTYPAQVRCNFKGQISMCASHSFITAY